MAVRCGDIVTARFLLDAGAAPLNEGDSHRLHETAMGIAACLGLRDMSQLFRDWLTSQSVPHSDEYQDLVKRCLYAAAAHGRGAIVFDYLNWPSFAWSELNLETAWLTAINRWEADVVDMLFPTVQKTQATVEKALRRALAFKTILPEMERGRAQYTPEDQMQKYRIVLGLCCPGGDADGLEHGELGRPLLHMAISGTVLQGGMHALLNGGANPDIRDSRGRTALHLLTCPISKDGQGKEVHREGIGLLLEKGAKATTEDSEGETPLQWAAMNSHGDLFRFFLYSCADQDAALKSQNLHGESLLHYAAAGGQCHVIEYLLDRGLDVNAPSQSGWTPLLCALAPTSSNGYRKTRSEALRAAWLLLSHGATTTAVTTEGWTSLHCVACYSDRDAVAPLTAVGLAQDLMARNVMLDINTCARGFDRLWLPRISKEARADLYGEEPWGFRVGKTLARCAATETAVVKDGMTLLHWAAERGALGVAKVLLEAGADPKHRDSTGSTQWKLAAKSELLDS